MDFQATAYEQNIPGKYILIFFWLMFVALSIDLDIFASITRSHNDQDIDFPKTAGREEIFNPIPWVEGNI
jgi:hypothetical protein